MKKSSDEFFQLYQNHFPVAIYRSNHPEVFLEKGILKICNKFTGENPCWSVISTKLLRIRCTQTALRFGCSSVNLLYFSEHLFLETPLDGCFWIYYSLVNKIIPIHCHRLIKPYTLAEWLFLGILLKLSRLTSLEDFLGFIF